MTVSFFASQSFTIFSAELFIDTSDPALGVTSDVISSTDTSVVRRSHDILSDFLVQEIMKSDAPDQEALRLSLHNEIQAIVQRLRVHLVLIDRILGIYREVFMK